MNSNHFHISERDVASNLRSRIKTLSTLEKPLPPPKESVFSPRSFPATLTKVHVVVILFVVYTTIYIRLFRGLVVKGTMWPIKATMNRAMHATSSSSLNHGIRQISNRFQGANVENTQLMKHLSTQINYNASSTTHQSTAAAGYALAESAWPLAIQRSNIPFTKDPTSSSQKPPQKAASLNSGKKPTKSQKVDQKLTDVSHPKQIVEKEEGEQSMQEEDIDDEWPVSNWNVTAIVNVNTTEHVFAYDRNDHAVMYRPLCVDSSDGSAFTIEGDTECSSINREPHWLHTTCEGRHWAQRSGLAMDVEKGNRTRKWLQDNDNQIRWVNDLTVLMALDRACGNIAHLGSRMLLLHHLLQNIEAYVEEPRHVTNIVIVPNELVMPWMNGEKEMSEWHTHMLKAVALPTRPIVSNFDAFLDREADNNFENRILHIVPSLMTETKESNQKYVCFKRAIVPGFFKGRYFLSDTEYPSLKASFKNKNKKRFRVPRDSIRLRELLMKSAVGTASTAVKRSKEIHLLDRGHRRIFEEFGRNKTLSMMKRVAKENGYKFVVSRFSEMSFREQVVAMKRASISVGIHGANLVNAMFMEPLSVLIELFPYGFKHTMYENGGNSGLQYISYALQSGHEYKWLSRYESVADCIKKEVLCKIHYRDATLHVKDNEVEQMERLLKKAIGWLDGVDSD